MGCTVEIYFFTRELRDMEQEIFHRKGWVARLPEGADEARKLAQDVLEEREKNIGHVKGRRETEVTRRAAYVADIAEDIGKSAFYTQDQGTARGAVTIRSKMYVQGQVPYLYSNRSACASLRQKVL